MDRPPVTIADWTALLARSGVEETAAAAAPGAALIAAYETTHRHYHSLGHLGAVLAMVDELGDLADDPDLVRLAAWYHDAVYEPDGPGDDERRSAELASGDLTALGLVATAVDEVARLVRLTATHDPAPDDRNGAVLCDADLWILGAEQERYERYVGDVRTEYAHVPDEAWRSGRAAVLRSFVDRAVIYQTTPGHRREPAARANLGRELSRLTR